MAHFISTPGRKINGTSGRWSGISFRSPSEPAKVRADMAYDYVCGGLNAIQGISYRMPFSSKCDVDHTVTMVVKIIKLAA